MSNMSRRTKEKLRKKKRNTAVALVILAAAVLLAAVLLVVRLRSRNQKLTEQEQAAQTMQTAVDALPKKNNVTVKTDSGDGVEIVVNPAGAEEEKKEDTMEQAEAVGTDGAPGNTAETAPEKTEGKTGQNAPEQNKPDDHREEQQTNEETPVQPVQELPADITFPYDVPGTSLRIINVYSYDGVFVEDGSDSAVSGIAVMGLKNTGSKPVEYVSLSLTQNGRELTFTASDVVAGGYVLVEEAKAASYTEGAYQQGSVEIAEVEELGFAPEVSVAENDSGRLVVTNLTEKDIPCVRVFYKLYVESSDTYVGGITYTAKLTDLKAGASLTVTPSHYAAGYSRVVMTRVYDTAE